MNTTSRFPSTASLASIGSLLAACSARAEIIYFPSSSFSVSDDVSAKVAWDVDGAGTILANFSVQNTYSNSRIVRLDFESKGAFVSNGNASLLALNAGQIVGAGQVFSHHRFALITYGAIKSVSGVTSGTPAFIGFSFTENGKLCYGWASITITEGASVSTVAVNEWAFQNDGTQITVGAVPEPAETAVGLGALALGAAGLRSWRKAKVAKVA